MKLVHEVVECIDSFEQFMELHLFSVNYGLRLYQEK